MNVDDNNNDDGALRGWVTHGSGYEMTRCRPIIAKRLKELKQRKIPIVLVHEKYQSGYTLLLAFKDKHLLIDKPLDWSGSYNSIRVIYRDPNGLWNHFYGKVVKSDSDTLYVTAPSTYYILQRREHYRVEPPSGSVAAFLLKKTLYSNITIKDISAGGMLLMTPREIPLEADDSLEEIMLTLPLEEGNYSATLLCGRGELIRVSHDPQKGIYMLAVKFDASDREIDAIIRYVRQRELDLLRKAAANP